MRIVRGSLSDAHRDREVTQRLAAVVEESGEPALRVWTPPRHVAFGRRDAAADGYDRACAAAIERGYEPIERSVGGHAVAYTGRTLAFVHAVATDGRRDGIESRYADATDRLEGALVDLEARVDCGEPDGSFCPGDHSLQWQGKLAGVAQRVRREHAIVGGCVVAVERDERDVAAVLEPVYDALEVPFDPESVGSVESAGGPGDADAVIEAVEEAFVDGHDATFIDAPTLFE